MIEDPNGGRETALHVVSPDIKTWNWLVKKKKKSIRKHSIYRPLPKKALFFIFGCDFKCGSETCLRKFLFALRNDHARFGILRPTLFLNQRQILPEYIIEIFPRVNDFSHDGDENKPIESIYTRELSCNTMKHNILHLQKYIIDNHGKIDSVSRLKNDLVISNRHANLFLEETNLHLKTYIDKIRMCNALWKITSSIESVKSVAYEFSLNPKAFSRKFFGIFKKWPSEVKKIAESMCK